MSVAAARGFLLHKQNAFKMLFIRRLLCSFRPFFKTLFTRLSLAPRTSSSLMTNKSHRAMSRRTQVFGTIQRRRFEQPFKFRIGSESTIVEQMHFCSDIIECKLRARRGKNQNSVTNLNKIPIIQAE